MMMQAHPMDIVAAFCVTRNACFNTWMRAQLLIHSLINNLHPPLCIRATISDLSQIMHPTAHASTLREPCIWLACC
jgi:hypothetical protein